VSLAPNFTDSIGFVLLAKEQVDRYARTVNNDEVSWGARILKATWKLIQTMIM
jgi:hypothetical protein